MSPAIARRVGRVILTAPVAGRVHLHPPRTLCGELEVFDGGETIAELGSFSIVAPALGFVVRSMVADGAMVGAGAPVAAFSFRTR